MSGNLIPVNYQLWYTEDQTPHTRIGFRIRETLLSTQTRYQKLDVLDTEDWGRLMVLDGCVMVTEKDEFVYHEMMVHVPCSVHPNVRDVLVIGGGDGGTVRELVKYKGIRAVDMVEIDKAVVDAAMRYFPTLSSGYKDRRVRLHFKDGAKFVASKKEKYDLVIVDSTDPIGPGEVLFSKTFYRNVKRSLRADGMMICQSESPMLFEEAVHKVYGNLKSVFSDVQMMLAGIPSYPSGTWSFAVCSKKANPAVNADPAAWRKLRIKTRYYNPEVHQAAFALPNYIRDIYNQS